MKQRFTAFTVLALLALPFGAHAALLRAGDEVMIGGEEITNDIYAAGGSVVLNAPLLGDLVAVGGNILVSSAVNGDAALAGGTITVTSSVSDDLRAAAGNLTISGPVGGDAVLAGGQISILQSAIVAQDAVLTGGAVSIHGTVHGSVRVAAGDVTVSGFVDGDVTINAERIVIEEGAVIRGKLTYRSAEEAQIAPGAQIGGGIDRQEIPARTKGAVIAGIATWKFATLLMLLVASFVLFWLMPRVLESVVTKSGREYGMTLLTGFLVLVATPIAAIIGFVSIIGIPLSVALLFLYASLVTLSYLIAPIIAGSLIWKWFGKTEGYPISWQSIVLGVATLFLIGIIPILGGLIKFLLMLLALGGLCRFVYERRGAIKS